MDNMPRMLVNVLGAEVHSFLAMPRMPKRAGLEKTLVRGKGERLGKDEARYAGVVPGDPLINQSCLV